MSSASPTRFRAARGLVTILCALGLVVAVLAAIPTTAAAVTLVARDTMGRTVDGGFGQPDLGGAYTVSSPSQTSVHYGVARFDDVAGGTAVDATLQSVQLRDIGAQVTVSAPDARPSGAGMYFDLVLRRQANGDAYYAKLRFRPDGTVEIGLSRILGGVQYFLTEERLVASDVQPGDSITLQAQAIGAGPTVLAARAWPSGADSPSYWQVKAEETVFGGLSDVGALGARAYLSSSASESRTIGFRGLRAWDGPVPAESPDTPTDPTPPPTDPTPPPTDPTPPTGSAGAAPIGSTSYAVPSSALIVSGSGSDSAQGTLADPFRTLGHAVSVAPDGATIVLRGGTYHESVTIPSNRPLTIQPYPNEAVWLDGSTEVDGWSAQGDVWVHKGWTERFSSVPSYDPDNVPSGAGWSFINPQYPMAAHPDQVWIDGKPLVQVGSADAVGPGEFYADYANQRLVVGSEPNNRQVRASAIGVALSAYAPNTVVRGIGIRRYANAVSDRGAVRLMGDHSVLENVVTEQNATTGLSIFGTSSAVRRVTASDNGLLGMGATYADGLVVSGVLSEHNNIEHFNQSPVSGGMKIGRTRGISVSNSTFARNLGYGLWFDESCYGMTAVRNLIVGNEHHGMSVEISSTGTVAGNVITGSGSDGLKINDTSDLRVWNNTITGNTRQVEIVEDTRRGDNPSDPGHDPRQQQPDPTMPWIIRNIQFANNFLGAPARGDYELYVRDYSGEFVASDLNLMVDGNRMTTVTSGAQFAWPAPGGDADAYNSVSAFASATGQGRNNTEQLPAAQLDSGVAAHPLPLPDDVAALLGVAPDARITGAP